MKVRVKWTKTGVLKFIGHLDVQRYFQKALMRAELPVSFSKGMSPHQIMSFAAPLGLGMTSEGEYADISFDWTYSSEEMLSRINAVMNEGISVLEFKEIDEKEKNCMAVTEAADYLVTFREGYYYKDAFLKRTQPFYLQEKIPVIKKTKRSDNEVDIAPLILDIREYESEPLIPGLPLKQEGIFMKLVTGSAENLKPQLVMEAFCKYLGYDYDPMGFQYHRLETYLKKDGELQPLGSVGWEITEEKLERDHAGIPHGGFVIRSGVTGQNRENKHVIEYSLKLDSNPEFTAAVIVAYARAINRLHKEGVTGCKTVFDIAPAYLSKLSAEEIRAHLL